MKNYGLRIIAGVALLSVAISCTQNEGDDYQPGIPTQEELVEVGFSLKINSLSMDDGANHSLFETGYDSTRVIPDNIKDDNTAIIRNLWVIQFEDGVGGPDIGSRKMVGVPRFISGSDLDDATQTGRVQLIGTENDCYILWVANHPMGDAYKWNLPLNATMNEVVGKVMQIEKETDTYPTFPALGGVPTILMNAITATSVTTNAPLEPEFYRNYARVTLKLKLDAPGDADDYKVLSVRLRNIPTNVTLNDRAMGAGYTGIIPSENVIYPYGSTMIDYPVVEGSGITLVNKGAGDTNTQSFTWYVPRNQQGTSESLSIADKNYYAPANATYFEVIVQHKKDASTYETAVFRVYPGRNHINDYILLPNHAYTSSLVVKGIGGDPSVVDSRVESFADVSYSKEEAANSYIVNPAPEGGQVRRYTIPITQAITYWSGSYDGYGNTPANVIKEGDIWAVALLWADHARVVTDIKIENSGHGVGPSGTFTIAVPAGMPECNFAIKLSRYNSAQGSLESDILWSWHFWVTDYNPNAFDPAYLDHKMANPRGDVYTYPVPNGQVERYGGAIWETGAYKDKVIMDRPLGALENYFTTLPSTSTSLDNMTRGYFHYQFGRKDPFPSVTANSSGEINTLPYGQFKTRITNYENADMVYMATSVLNPTQFYNNRSSGNWCRDADGSIATRYVWHDSQAYIGSINDETYLTKSIYDPCPPGWRLPSRYTWDDFNQEITTHNMMRDLAWIGGRGLNNVNALRYWPGGAASPVGGTIYYATSGYRGTGTALSVGGITTDCRYWSAIPYSNVGSGCSMVATSTAITKSGQHRCLGFSVRCVSE